MKKILFALISMLAVTQFFSCTKKVEEKEITLVMAEVNPAETIAGQMDQAFKQKVEELSQGKIKIDLQCSGILGDIDTLMTMATKPGSSVHILRLSAQSFAPYDCKKTLMLTIPYTFSNKDHFWRFANSETADEILNEPLEHGLGVKGLFFGEEGFRHFFSTKKIVKVEDFAGLKVRGTNDKAMQGLIAGVKATSVPVNFADLYVAIQTGVIDVAEQPISNYLQNHFNEVAPYMIFDGHTLGTMITAITKECWDSLTEKQQNILIEAGKYASEFCRKLSQTEEDKVKAQLLAEGATLTSVDDVTPWQKACASVIEEGAKADPLLYQDILNYAKSDAQPPRKKAVSK